MIQIGEPIENQREHSRTTHYGFDVRSIRKDGTVETVRYILVATTLYPRLAPFTSGRSYLVGTCDPSNMRKESRT